MRTKLYWDRETRQWVEFEPRIGPKVHIIDDNMECRSQATGKMFTSKSEYRKDLKARGKIEVGNERAALAFQKPAPLDVSNDLRRAASERGGY